MIKQWSWRIQKCQKLFFNFHACIWSSIFKDDTCLYMSRAICVSSFELSKYAATSTADQLVSSNCFIAIQFKTKLNSAVKTGLVFIFTNLKHLFPETVLQPSVLHLSTNASCTNTLLSSVSFQIHTRIYKYWQNQVFNIFFLKVFCNLLLWFSDKGVLASCLLNQYSLVMCLPNLLSLLKDHSTNFASKPNVTFFWRSSQHFVVRLNNVQIYVLYWNCGGISCPIFYWICLIVSYQHQQKHKTILDKQDKCQWWAKYNIFRFQMS